MTVLRSRVLAAALMLATLAACTKDVLSPTDNHLETSTPAAEGIDNAALATLIAHATDELSDAVIILRHGKIVYENHFGKVDQPIYAASVSKSFISLAYGYLLADGKLASLDEKVVKYLPAFANNDPRKADITLRMLLSNTSGLKPGQAQYVGKSVEAFAIDEPLVFAPGTSWQYLNAGADLAGVLVTHIAGETIDTYLQKKLFSRLGITDAYWDRGAFNMPLASGAAGGLHIRPMDLAKVGQTVLDGGKWKGEQIIPAAYITLASQQSQTFETDYGLFWWRAQNASGVQVTNELIDMWEGNGISTALTTKVRPLAGTVYPAPGPGLSDALQAALTSTEFTALTTALKAGDHISSTRVVWAPTVFGVAFEGYGGQYMFAIPSAQIVAVRMRAITDADRAALPTEPHPYSAFMPDAYHLVPSTQANLTTNATVFHRVAF